jgi:site-specific recombinase XerD
MFLRYCHDVGWTRENAARFLRPALCGRPLPRALAEDETKRLLTAIDHPRDHALFHLLVGTGIRIGSALALDVPDVDLPRRELILRRAKGDRTERVYLPGPVREELARHVASRTTGPVFLTRAGARLRPRQAHRRLSRWLKLAGITSPASPHALRHTFATHLLRKTGDILLVQKALRHRNIESTLRYAALDDRRVREALEA